MLPEKELKDKSEDKCHRYDNTVNVEIIGGQITIRDILDCENGVKETIDIESYGEKIRVEGIVDPDGTNEVKAYRNGNV